MPPSPTQPRRSAIPRSFRRPSLNSTSQSQSQGDKERDLAVAADGSFVETTSAAAARAMARFYAQQAGLAGEDEGEGGTGQGAERELYGVVKVEREGRTVYRVKPLARPPPSPASSTSSTSSSSATHSSTSAGRLPFARPSHQPGPSSPLPVVAEPLPPSPARKGLRQSRSIPVLRSTRLGADEEEGGGNGLLSPKDAVFPTASTSSSSSSSSNYVSPSASPPSATAQPTPTLRRPGSSPTLNRFAPSHLAPPLSSLSSAPSASAPTGRLPPNSLNSASVPHLASAAPYSGSGGKRGRSAGPAGEGGGGPEGDVLGRILGWREGLGAESGGSGRKKGGAARLGELPGLTGERENEKEKEGEGKKLSEVSAGGSDRSDLPDDPVLEELDASALPPHPFAALSPPRRPSVSLTRSKTTHGPFGAGVRVPRVGPETTLRPALPERRSRSEGAEEDEPAPGTEGKKLGHAMREVSSNDSIRTATAEYPQPLAVPPSLPTLPAAPTTPPPASTKRRRFEDPTIFSVFHRLAHPSSPPPSPLASPSSRSSPRVSDVPPAPFGTHGRLPSSASLASTASHTSSTSQADSASAHRITIATAAPGDDPRFCIWGYRDPPSSASSTAQHQHPGSPPQQHARRNSGAAPSTPARSAGGDLRRQSIAEEEAPVGPGSPAPSSSPATSSRRWSVSQRGASSSSAGGAGVSSPATSVRDSVDSGAGGSQNQRRILMAATVERLIAELTSEISAELLPEVFLTFRHYVSPLDLLRLLLTRFEWAMTPPSPLELTPAQAAEDDALRRVVRVRTFVVLRYWLLNHFMEDFYPHREVRTTLTTWLNTAGRDDDRFKSSPKDMRLVKQLKKTVRRCKETYVLGAAVPPPPPPAAPVQPAEPTVAPIAEEDVDLSDEASALPPPPTAPMHPPTSPASSPSFGFSSLRSRSRSGRLFPSASFSGPPPAATPTDPHEGSGGSDPFVLPGSSGSQNAIARSFSSAMGTFGRLKRRIAAGAAGGRSGSTASGGSVGGVGGGNDERDRGALELERSEGGDLLWVKGGLERYLEYWGIEREAEADGEEGEKKQQQEKEEGTPALVQDSPADGSGASSSDAATPRPDFSGAVTAEPVVVGAEQHAPVGQDDSGVGLGLGLEVVSSAKEAVSKPPVAAVDYAFPPRSTPPATTAPPIPLFDPASYDAPPSQPPAPAYTFTLDRSSFAPRPSYGHTQSHFARPHSTRIELDDLDDSSDDDEDVVEVKKTLKRLPAATNLRLAAAVGGPGAGIPPHHLQRSPYRRSMDSELSYGFPAGGGIGGLGAPWNPDDDAPRESVLFVDDEDGYGFGPGGEPVTVIPNFILDGLLSDDEDDEPGDVEAALRRLEGLVDYAKERDKARRVEKQMEKSSRLEERRRRRLARIEAGEEVGFDEEDEEDEEDGDIASTPSGEGSRKPSLAASVEVDEPVVTLPLMAPSKQEQPVNPAPVIDTIPPSAPLPSSPTPAPAPVAGYASSQSPPISRLQVRRTADPSHSSSFRKPSISRIFGVRPLSTCPAAPAPSAGLAAPSSSTAPPTHRSFLLFCRTELLAQQFTLIERDLLRMLSYQELVSGSWREQVVSGETDALDWEAYLKERRRSDVLAKQRGEQPRSAVQDIIARFNLTANWTASEILLTASVEERAILIAKFIRLAFKCYCQHNFQTLTQIIHGLQIPHVERLRKTWAKVPAWEMRKFKGMKEFCSHLKNFKHLREVTSALLSEYGAPGQHSAFADAIGAGAASKGCIPFLGLFLRDLALNAELPTFLDPSSPNTPASVSPSGSLLSLSSPSFSSFPPLPPLPAGVELAPLVNVHKFRLLAATVQRVVAFQELAGRYGAEPSPREYFRCLKIRCLEQGVMSELSARLEA
ncbi:hypothetical protein JCM8097_002317 [Rhodosporidiobolus ruineniae]